ncbi:MAG: carboxymuconolactone decarboxylase family protein [Balneolaceae bacterium]|nr:carboxymuconolactone decarboxylase family protein [Balneolaceae bacterium]
MTRTIILSLIFTVSFFSSSFAQSNDSYGQARIEIEQEFGAFPEMFDVFPKHALPAAWEKFKELNGPESAIPPKYRELLQLSVASQIPCNYCIYFHTASAKAYGANEEEIQEAVAHGAQTRHWSMILQGNQIDLEEFKNEFDKMMEYMSAQSENE